jgi:hypothetical protein
MVFSARMFLLSAAFMKFGKTVKVCFVRHFFSSLQALTVTDRYGTIHGKIRFAIHITGMLHVHERI